MSALLDDQVLTLKDTSILENEEDGDELENLELREKEKLDQRLELKKMKPAYDPTDESATILSQYDDDSKKKTRFTLSAMGTIPDLPDLTDAGGEEKKKLDSLSLDILKDAQPSDYLDISEVKVKKPKKKRSKATRQRAVDDDDVLFPGDEGAAGNADESMDIDSGAGPSTKKRRLVDEPLVDDDDLQATLARQRSSALKKRKRARPEDIAKQLREEGQSPEPTVGGESQNGGLVIDEISEFVSSIRKLGDDEDSKPRTGRPANENAVTAMEGGSEDEDGDVPMENAPRSPAGEEESDWQEEKTIGEGLGAALELLKSRNIIEENHGSELNERFVSIAQYVRTFVGFANW